MKARLEAENNPDDTGKLFQVHAIPGKVFPRDGTGGNEQRDSY
ncbi:MAG: hypothetical protein V2B18_11630 [Pseudomonadota bacterium]